MLSLRKKTHKMNRMEFVFFVCYVFYITYTLFGSSFYVRYYISIYTYGVAIILLPLIISELMCGKIKKRALLYIPLCALLTLIIMRVSDNGKTINIIALLLFIYSARNLTFEKVANVTVITNLTILFLIILSSKIGIIQNYISFSFGRRREYLGFLYALTPLSILANVVLLEVYIHRNKMPFHKLVAYGTISYLLFLKTNSRLNFSIILIALFINICSKMCRENKFIDSRIVNGLMCMVFPICAITSIYLAYTYSGSGWHAVLNSLLGSRLRLAHSALNQYGISLLGNEIEWIGWALNSQGEVNVLPYNYVDNAYVQILVQYGVIMFVLFVISFSVLQIFLCKKQEYFLAMIFSIVAFHGLIDDSIFSLAYNSFWLVFAQMLSSGHKTIKIKLAH